MGVVRLRKPDGDRPERGDNHFFNILSEDTLTSA